MDILGKLVRTARKLDKRTTNENKQMMINEMNKYNKGMGLNRISNSSSIREVNEFKKKFNERLGYDILGLAIEEGNTTIASVYSKDYKNAKDKEVSRLAKYSEQLAESKRLNDKYLKKTEIAFLEKGNENIKGYGNENILELFKKAKTKKQVESLINTLKNQNPKEEFYNKNIETFNRVFQKIEGVREEDLNKVRKHLKESNFFDVHEKTNYLLKSLELYGSDQVRTGAGGDDLTELANARLNDLLIKYGLKNDEKRSTSKVLKKYKERTDKAKN